MRPITPADVEMPRCYLAGQALELWEDRRRPFSWRRCEMDAYAARGRWDLLFNALALNASDEDMLPLS
ncbi:MAG: hypothetical protein RL698_868 [Pseudomonadota bacterium]|jgi:hypothetical protein